MPSGDSTCTQRELGKTQRVRPDGWTSDQRYSPDAEVRPWKTVTLQSRGRLGVEGGEATGQMRISAVL